MQHFRLVGGPNTGTTHKYFAPSLSRPMNSSLLRTLLILAVLCFIYVISKVARKRTNRTAKHPDRIRAPKILAVLGWLILPAGILFTLLSFAANIVEPMSVGAKITAVGLVILGALFLLTYFRWYLIVEYESIERRGMVLAPRKIYYRDIVSLQVTQNNRQQVLHIKTASGPSMGVNMTMFNIDKLLAWATFSEQAGRPPTVQEIQFHKDTGQWPSVTPRADSQGSLYGN